MSVIELKTRTNVVKESIIERLEELLAAAHDGKLTSFAVAGVDDEGCIVTSWSLSDDSAKLLGAINRLNHLVNTFQDNA